MFTQSSGSTFTGFECTVVCIKHTEEHVVLFAQFVSPQFKLVHDSARPHSTAVRGYLGEVGINTVEWPSKTTTL